MPILGEAGALVPDRWAHAGDESHLPAGQNFIVCLDRLKRDQAFLFARELPLGVLLAPGTPLAEVAEFLDRLDLVSIEFAKFRDGRGFTAARTLRERHGFEREIRATGYLLPDQADLLLRAGFSSIALPESADVAVWQRALARFDLAYQPGFTAEMPLGGLRRRI